MNEYDYMKMAIDLAKKAEGFTNPNPLVGAVIVKDGKIIGKGYHERCGELHAERNAIKNLTESAKGATIYVTLEPCCHYGKTPPCTEAIIEAEISKVVIGSRDPNPMVSGKGAKILREAGIEVVEDFMREECDKLNPIFFHYITNKTPYVVMKYAMTADGKIATKTGASQWISCEESRKQVHRMRHKYMGIMVGINTVIEDDPMLNTRIEGLTSPVRIICDTSLRIPLESKIVKTAGDYKTIVAYSNGDEEKIDKLKNLGVVLIKCEKNDDHIDLKDLMVKLGEEKIDSVLVEGGAIINESVLKAGIANELKVYIAPKIFGGKDSKTPVAGAGVALVDDAYKLELMDTKIVGEDILLEYKVK